MEHKDNKGINKQINFKVTERQYKLIEDCCEMLGVSKSDFVRNATFNYINQCYIQEVVSKMYHDFKNIDLSNATKEEIIKFQVTMDMLQNISDVGKK